MRAEELDCRSQGYEEGYEDGATAERGKWELVIQAAIADLCPICAGGGKEPVYHSQSNGWYHRDGPPGNWCMAGRVRSMVRVIKEADDG